MSAPALPIPPSPPVSFFGRQPEGRAVILSARAGRSVVLVAPTGYGKSTLLAELAPVLEELAATMRVAKIAPFGTFLTDLAGELARRFWQVKREEARWPSGQPEAACCIASPQLLLVNSLLSVWGIGSGLAMRIRVAAME